MRAYAPAAARNREAIADVLSRWLPPTGLVLEVASGTGEHATMFAWRFPHIVWQPSDPAADALTSIEAWRVEANLPNLRSPIRLDAASDWPPLTVDGVVCINMVRISPWAATLGLIAGAAASLARGNPLILYGPFLQDGVPLAPSNADFDASLRSRDPSWGLRQVKTVSAAASPRFVAEEVVAMPANNLMLLYRRTEARTT